MTADCSVAGGTEHFAAGGADSFVTQAADCSVARGTEWGAEYFRDVFWVGSTHYHPSLLHVLPHSYKWGNTVPMSIFLLPALALPWHSGLLQLGMVPLSSQWEQV